jgi:hypothetical protein
MEWVSEHAPANPVPGAPLPKHVTTAPLISCKPFPGLPPFLHRLSTDTPGQQAGRARLLLGRARTGTVQQRFARAADAASVIPTCTYCPPSPQPIPDSIQHMLLECGRHAAARAQLESDVRKLSSDLVPLSLATILVTSKPSRLPQSALTSLLQATAIYLSAIAIARSAAGLLPLDTG